MKQKDIIAEVKTEKSDIKFPARTI